MVLFLSLVYASEPTATLLVSPEGNYHLNISLHQQWENAEVTIDQPIGQLFRSDFEGLQSEGVFETIPELLNIRMNLANQNEGAFFQTSLLPVFTPFQNPSLAGTKSKPLQDYSLSWKWYRFFYDKLTSHDKSQF